jgi:hypothetical protein
MPTNQGKSVDMVNHPPHYNQGRFETIDVIEDITRDMKGFEAVNIGHVVRYISRFPYKNGLEDLKKAQWYLNRLIDKIEGEI